MASNARIFTTDGKSTGGAKTFGTTVSDRQAVPNLSQLTFVPASGTTIQSLRYVLNARDTDGMILNDTLTMTPDLTLVSGRIYQFHAILTVIVYASSTYYTGLYVITSAAKDATSLIGSGYGYRLDTITSEDGINTYIDEDSITLAISGNKFVITATAKTTITKLEMFGDISINNSVYQ